MKLVRVLLFAAAAFVLLLVAAVVVAFNSSFQTWVARRALASRPALHTTIGSVAAGLSHVEVKNLRVESHGAVLTLPALEAELPLISAGLRDKVIVTRLVAKGWTLDLTKAANLVQIFEKSSTLGGAVSPPRKAVSQNFSLLSSALAADASVSAATAQIFQGVFARLQLPVDLALDGVALEGEVLLPGARGHARFTLTGGGLSAGHEGKFDLAANAALTATAVSTLDGHATFAATMDTPRSFTRLAVKGDATASGVNFPRGVKLATEFSAARAASGEDYTLTLATDTKQLIAVSANFPPTARQLGGTWKLDVRDADLAPFTLGRALPPFTADGGGKFEVDPATIEIHATGKLAAASENLTALRPALAAVGAIKFSADFDVTQRGDVTRVERLAVTFTGAQPVATLTSLQSLEFNRVTRALKVADPARELFALALQGVPLAWATPFLKNISATGGDLRGEFVATASEGGFSLRPKAPLTLTGVSVTQAGQPMLRGVDVSLNASVDYTPHGWQASIAPLTARTGAATLLTLEAKAGQLAGVDQPIKAAGKFSADLPAWLAQPVAGGALLLTHGDATGEFAANLGTTQEIQAKLVLANLAADPKLTTEKLPTISADVRADLAANGQISLNAPLLIERDGRKSDLAIVGTLTSGTNGMTIAARVTSTHLVVDDVKILAAPLAPAPVETTAAVTSTPRAKVAPWAAINGQLALALKEVILSDTFHANDVGGTIRVDASTLKFDQVRAGVGNGEAKVSGAVTFDAKSAAPFSLTTDLAVSEFDPAPLFKALNPGQPATVEGKFNVTSKLTGSAISLADLATAAHGDFQLASKGGVFRGLPINVAGKVEAVGKLAAGAAFLGNLAGAMTGRKEYSDIGTRAQALAEVAKIWQAVNYDQLSVVVTRDANLNTVLKDFTLISPELRLTGGGQATHVKDRPLLDEAVAMEFKLRARGHHGELLKYLGVLEATTDELGYAACTLPLKVTGTIGKPDTSELNSKLTALALEKSGVTEKASDLFNKLLGGGK